MEFILDKSLAGLGIQQVVIATMSGIDLEASLSEEKQLFLEHWQQKALALNLEELDENPIVIGYRELVQQVGRSSKKNPPTAEALIKNIQRRGSLPRINTVVDWYNAETLQSYLSIGAHDLDKIQFPVEFTISKREDTFYPIMAPEKKVAATDLVYRDQQGILAYLDCRDSELYKITPQTKKLLLVIQGHRHTSVSYRQEALERICLGLKAVMPELQYRIQVLDV
ncbi:hypothetical protein Ami103574_05515 [Aminipila butyrica]|uniref:B3/B4 tRNA-binding domain-containing protein n=1 Tax=Aminipila butyrica TaxID=433296 RepID=A0A858BS70_9FIRM|nr:phenylalanine--tRNA ligase beta subunit-related protein [Aminipila butyrica]QIB68811.1 hypothetical protein Ami103574_05515 [Aminipila butyrica]